MQYSSSDPCPPRRFLGETNYSSRTAVNMKGLARHEAGGNGKRSFLQDTF
jgi:hypothetical protein